jgi:uncharacterized protein with von Willebrand factor type A (vWA) domain
MEGKKREDWMELCADAANEQDSKKLMKLIEQINRLLLEKEARLKSDDSGAGNAKRIAWGQLIIGKGTEDGR